MASYILSSLLRYPVKSMAGEELNAVDVSARGLCGDRAYVLADPVSGKVGSAKSVRRFADLLKCRVRFETPPSLENPISPVEITLPDGSLVRSAQPDAVQKLTAVFGEPLALRTTAPGGLMLEFDAGTLGGKFSATTEVALEGAPAGTFFDSSAVHLITTSTLRALQET